jgi:hypothetical protein
MTLFKFQNKRKIKEIQVDMIYQFTDVFLNEPLNIHSDNNGPLNGPLNKANKPLNEANRALNEPLNEPLNGPVNGPLNEPLSGPLSGNVKIELANIILILVNEGCVNRNTLINKLGKGRTTVTRYLNILRQLNIIEFIGSKKTGAYYFTAKAKEIFYQKR